jgi:hypothetical protein
MLLLNLKLNIIREVAKARNKNKASIVFRSSPYNFHLFSFSICKVFNCIFNIFYSKKSCMVRRV